MQKATIYTITGLGVGILSVSAVAGGLWLRHMPAKARPAGLVYTSEGYGGYVGASRPRPAITTSALSTSVQATIAHYTAGQYAQAEASAQKVLAEPVRSSDLAGQHDRLRALRIAAYSAAWRQDYSAAREEFASLRDAASHLPDHGAETATLGEPAPTFEEEGAFQHAVCTKMLEGADAGQAEYERFISRYPDSILIHAAMKRVARLHGGDVPAHTEKLWKQALAIQAVHTRRTQREASLCGPRCLAELLKRRGQQVGVHALANEMHTDERGTSFEGFVHAANQHGIPLQGVALTQAGLMQQKLPVVALITPGHFVIVEQVSAQSVTVWNPDAQGAGKPGTQQYSLSEWSKCWDGAALTAR